MNQKRPEFLERKARWRFFILHTRAYACSASSHTILNLESRYFPHKYHLSTGQDSKRQLCCITFYRKILSENSQHIVRYILESLQVLGLSLHLTKGKKNKIFAMSNDARWVNNTFRNQHFYHKYPVWCPSREQDSESGSVIGRPATLWKKS